MYLMAFGYTVAVLWLMWMLLRVIQDRQDAWDEADRLSLALASSELRADFLAEENERLHEQLEAVNLLR